MTVPVAFKAAGTRCFHQAVYSGEEAKSTVTLQLYLLSEVRFALIVEHQLPLWMSPRGCRKVNTKRNKQELQSKDLTKLNRQRKFNKAA